MTKLYTGTVPTTTVFLSSEPPEDVDFSQYNQIFLNVNGVHTSVHIHKDYQSAIYRESQNKLPSDWIGQLVYDSIETQGTNLIHKLTLSKQMFEHSDSEVKTRAEVFQSIGFEITEQDI